MTSVQLSPRKLARLIAHPAAPRSSVNNPLRVAT
jgi:hypothetical protein